MVEPDELDELVEPLLLLPLLVFPLLLLELLLELLQAAVATTRPTTKSPQAPLIVQFMRPSLQRKKRSGDWRTERPCVSTPGHRGELRGRARHWTMLVQRPALQIETIDGPVFGVVQSSARSGWVQPRGPHARQVW